MNPERKFPRHRTSRAGDRITLRRVGPGSKYELAFPRSVAERAADMEEVRTMLAAEEIDVAEDELRWLVGGCRVLLEGHKLLGQIAAGENNWEVARAHYAYAYELGVDATRSVRPPVALPYARAANRDLHEAGRGLVECLVKLGEHKLAMQIVEQLLAWDPTDPLAVRALGGA